MTEAVPLGWLYLPVAFSLGALHALEPGHGKSLASAYLVGGRHDWKDALVLGAATTLSHTGVVVALALLSMGLASQLPAERVQSLVASLGSLVLIALGVWALVRALKDLRHGHGHSHGHETAAGERRSFWQVALLGLSNGILPCPGALAALVLALSLGQVALGLVTVLTYSLGLATALFAVGVVAIEAGRRARAWLPSDHALLWLPVASASLVLGAGVWLLWGGLLAAPH